MLPGIRVSRYSASTTKSVAAHEHGQILFVMSSDAIFVASAMEENGTVTGCYGQATSCAL